MSRPKVFVSYSHKDEKIKDRVLEHLAILPVDVWDDRRIFVGRDWRNEIDAAMDEASVAVLLVSVNFLTSTFIQQREVPELLQKKSQRGLHIFPLIVRACPWQRIEWLSRLQTRPRDGRPLASFRGHAVDEVLTGFVNELWDILARDATPPPVSAPVTSTLPVVDELANPESIRWTREAKLIDGNSRPWKRHQRPEVVFQTTKGTFEVELYANEAPNTVRNFLKLVTEKFYDGIIFHRVIPDFVVQGGDPITKEASGLNNPRVGSGGPGWQIKCETQGNPHRHEVGALSMAHAGKDTGGSQFFIVLSEQNTRHLNGVHTVFGKVTQGIDVVRQITRGDRMESVTVKEEGTV